MRRRMLPALLACAVLFAAGLGAAQTLAAPPKAESPRAEPPQGEPPQGKVTRTSRPVRLLRSWEEPVKLADGQGEVARRVDVVFDYDLGRAFEDFYTIDGIHTGRMALGAGQPAPSQEEIQEAYDIVRGTAEFEKLFKRFRVVLEGGFILTEETGRPCGPGRRCLRVFLLSSDRAGTIRQVVVDLVKRQLAYDDFAPEPQRNDR